MPSAIDHLVIAVADPEAAAIELAERVGIAAGGAGRHPGAGTYNRVAFLGAPYLELIGVDDAKLATGVPVGRATLAALERGGGLATYALLDDEVEATAAALTANGSSIGPVTHGSRQRPDGDVVEWWTAMPPELGPTRPPFLAKHRYAGAEWGADALAAREAFVHPIGSPARLVRLDIATDDPPSTAADYATTLGLEFWSVADLAVCSLGPHTIRLVPTREMPVPAVVVIAADVGEPRTIEAFGLRFDIEPVAWEPSA
jgi:Glyoxalase-like domain